MRALIWTLILLASAFAAPADELASRLSRGAWYWEARARSDKAEEAWKQVLLAAPDDPEALAAVGGFHARAGRAALAKDALARLEKLSPGHSDLPILRRQIELGPGFGPLLAQARKLVHAGKKVEGAAHYAELFGAAGPPGDLALEYYETLAGTQAGWEQARDGLRRLTRRAPAEPRFKLVLAKLLTYREESRREGIGLLAGLAGDPAVGRDATAAWREALLWLPPAGADVPLYRRYVAAHPGDGELARRLERARRADVLKEGFVALDRGDLRTAERVFRAAPSDPDARKGLELIAGRRSLQEKKAGFAALERGDLAAAEEQFTRAGDDADARLGLALVAQRRGVFALGEGDFALARSHLERAAQLAPQRKDLWQEPLGSAKFWGLLTEARDTADPVQAEAKLRAAAEAAPPRERWHAQLALADLYFARGDRKAAEAHYRDVLSSEASQPDALRALVSMLVEQGRYDEAIPINERLAKIAPSRAVPPGRLRSDRLRAFATRSRKAHDLVAARDALVAAHEEAPDSVWAVHDLANVLLELNDPGAAAPLVTELIRLAPGLPAARLTQVRLLAAQGQAGEALAAFDSIQPRPADPSAVALRRKLDVQVLVPEVVAQAQGGDIAGATGSLEALERGAADAPELLAQIAVAWSRIGAQDRAVSLMRSAMAKAPAATRGARLELASALLEAGDDAAVTQLLDGLDREAALSQRERQSLFDLRVAHAVRLADARRAGGAAPAAYTALDSVLRDRPEDPRLLAALGRLLERDDPGRAHELFLRAVAAAPEDVDSMRGAADTALALGRIDEAKELAEEGARRHPDDAPILVANAHVALAEGDDGAAVSAFTRALGISAIRNTAVRIEPASSTASLKAGADRRAARVELDPATRMGIEREIDRIRARHRPALGGAGEGRRRSGEPGLSRLDEMRGSVDADLPIGYAGRTVFRATEVSLEGGVPDASSGDRFGTASGTAPGVQRALGTELMLSWQGRHTRAFIGTTPLGFGVFSVLGGVGGDAALGPLRIGAELGRKSVTESVLSYAGTLDPATGLRWGGVVMDGGHLDLTLRAGLFTFSAYGDAHRLVGLRVAENLRGGGGGGIALALYRGESTEIGVGPTVAAFGFEKNLRFFTVGHGGYFSPQRFIHGGMALTVRREGAVRIDAAVEPGYDAYAESVTPVFPLDRSSTARYGGKASQGFSLNARAGLVVPLGSGVEATVGGSVVRSPQFQEVRGGVGLRIPFGAR